MHMSIIFYRTNNVDVAGLIPRLKSRFPLDRDAWPKPRNS